MLKSIKEVFFNWVDKRTPEVGKTVLRQTNIYILPTRYGWLMLIIMVLVLIAATNYQNNMGFMSGFIILSLGLLSIFYTYRNLRGLELSVLQPKSVFAGDRVLFPVEVNNPSHNYRFTIGLGENKKSIEFVDVKEFNRIIHNIAFSTDKRGYFKVKRFSCLSMFPFGIFQVWTWFRSDRKVLIYPRPIKCPEKLSNAANETEEGDKIRRGTEDFDSVKQYQVGEPFSRVMWKAYARGRGLLSKEFIDRVGAEQIYSWQMVAHFEKELAISYLTYEIIEADKAGIEYGLELPEQRIELSYGEQHLKRCLSALALL